MGRTGTSRGLLRHPTTSRRTGSFAIRAPQRTNAASGLHRLSEFTPKRNKEMWQQDAFTFYETLPPVGYVLDHTATTVAGCSLRLVEDDPIKGKVPTNNAQAEEVLKNLVGPRGGLAEILRKGALLLQICGEGYLVGSPVENEAEAIFWEFLSPFELIIPESQGQPYRRNATGSGNKEDMDPMTYVARMWRSDAKHGERAHCALRRCLDACREMTLLQQMVEAIISSRLPMGLLLVPDDMTWSSPLHRIDETSGGADDSVDDDDEPDFMDDLLRHMGAPIRDYGSAASLVPIVVSANASDLASVKVIELAKNLDTYAAGLRTEMIGRLALGLDVPPEVLQGKSMLNHWSAYNVDTDFLFKHVVPVGNLLTDFLTYAYLRPLLEIGGMNVEEAAKYSLLFDPSPLATRQNDDQKAIKLWEEGVISTQFMLARQGWDPDEAMPDEKERQRRFAERVLMASASALALTPEGFKGAGFDPKWFELAAILVAEMQAKMAADQAKADADAAAKAAKEAAAAGVVPPEQAGPTGPPGRPSRLPPGGGNGQGKDPAASAGGPLGNPQTSGGGGQAPSLPAKKPGEGAPPQPKAPSSGGTTAPKPFTIMSGGDDADTDSLLLVHRLAASADAARDRVLERLGVRALPALKKLPDCAQRLTTKRTIDVMCSVSPTELRDAGVSTRDLLTGAEWAGFEATARAWLRDHLVESRGFHDVAADAAARTAVARLVDQLHRFTVEHLHVMPMRLDGTPFKIPMAMCVEAVYLAETTTDPVVYARNGS